MASALALAGCRTTKKEARFLKGIYNFLEKIPDALQNYITLGSFLKESEWKKEGSANF